MSPDDPALRHLSRRRCLRLLLGAALAPLAACRDEPPAPAATFTPPRTAVAPRALAPPGSAPTAIPSEQSAAPAEAAATPSWRALDFEPGPARPRGHRAGLLDAGGEGVLIALHGRGESVTIERGMWGWRQDYLIDQAREALLKPPVGRVAYQGLVGEARLKVVNAALEAAPWRELRLLTPWTPDLIRASAEEVQPFARFLLDELLPAAGAAQTPVALDGVSLGGRVALMVGLQHPERLRALGAMQPAILHKEIPDLVRRAAAAWERHGLAIRLVTSQQDLLRRSTEALSDALRQARVPHRFLMTEGPHDYIWNQGPGAVEMLLWHERLLRGHAVDTLAEQR